MIRVNKNMKILLDNIKDNEIIKISTDNLYKVLFPQFIEVNDCIIINVNNAINVEKINLNKILSIFGDRTGYEASCNEIRINDYIDSDDGLVAMKLANIMIDSWEYKLKNEYPQKNFCIIISFNEGIVTMRFHVNRDNEISWLNSDLDRYVDEAILVKEV